VEQPAKWSSDPITPLPAVYVNEYSPLQELDTAPLIAVVPPTPVFAYPVVPASMPTSYPAMPQRLPARAVFNNYGVAPLESTVTPARKGLLKRYRLTEELEQNPISAFTGLAETYTGSLQSEMQPAHITEDLFYNQRPFFNVPPHQTVPEPIPVPVMVPSQVRGTLLRPRRLVPLPDNK
jgi:hypothetical protein